MLRKDVAVWPGDQSFAWTQTAQIGVGSAVNLGAFAMSVHAGTHADAPFHVSNQGHTAEHLPLSSFVGLARVVAVPAEAAAITPEHAEDALSSGTSRLLFKTRASRTPSSRWSDDFPPLLPETVEMLGEAGVVLVGTDAPSVDPADSTALLAHHALARRGIVNLENLNLREAAPGDYLLVALPLRIEGADAAPVRAALLHVEDAAAPLLRDFFAAI